MIDMFPYEENLVLNFPFSTSYGFVGGVGGGGVLDNIEPIIKVSDSIINLTFSCNSQLRL